MIAMSTCAHSPIGSIGAARNAALVPADGAYQHRSLHAPAVFPDHCDLAEFSISACFASSTCKLRRAWGTGCELAAPRYLPSPMNIRPATSSDREAIWSIMGPVIHDGATYTLPSDMRRRKRFPTGFQKSPGFHRRRWTSRSWNVFPSSKSAGRRQSRGQLRVYDSAIRSAPRHSDGDVPALYSTRKIARLSCHAIQLCRLYQCGRDKALEEIGV